MLVGSGRAQDSCDVRHDVEGAEPLDRRRNGGFGDSGIADVTALADDPIAVVAFVDRLGDIDGDDVRSLGEQPLDGGAPDP